MKEGATRAFGIALFVVIGASALILGVLNANKDISGSMNSNQPAVSQTEPTPGELDALKNRDTDGDSLSDYDELYVYHSSPYIKDSDSDGIDDGAEIKNGTDPNCPQGRDCGTPAPVNYPSTGNVNINDVTAAENALNDLDSLLANLNAPAGNANVPPANAGQSADGKAAVAAQIRSMLIDQGLSEAILNAIDDQTLIDMYNESAASVSANGNSNSNQ